MQGGLFANQIIGTVAMLAHWKQFYLTHTSFALVQAKITRMKNFLAVAHSNNQNGKTKPQKCLSCISLQEFWIFGRELVKKLSGNHEPERF